MAKTPLFSRQQSGGVFTIVNETLTTGEFFFVHSGTGTNSVGGGRNPDAPLATLDYAIGLCTANKGDMIQVMPGHAETLTAAGAIACDIAGISIVGMGVGDNRPVFTFGSTDNAATWTVSADDVRIANVVLVCNDDALTNALVVTGDGYDIDIEFQDTSATVEAATAVRLDTANNGRLKLRYLGFTAGNAVVSAVRIDDCDNVQVTIDGYGVVSTAWVEMVDVASINVSVRGRLYTQGITNFTRDVVDTIGGSTWEAQIFDVSAGAAISGGSAAALASDDITALATAISTIDEFHDVPAADNVLNAQINEVIGNKTDAAAAGAVTTTDTLVGYVKQLVTELAVVDEFHDVPAADNVLNAQINEVIGNKTDAAAAGGVTATDTLVGYTKQLVNVALATEQSISKVQTTPSGGADALFTVTGGPILVKKIIGIVTTVLAGAANGTLQATVTEPAATVAISTTVAIDNDAAGTSYRFIGATGVLTPVSAGVVRIDPVTTADCEFLVPIGNINFLTSGAMTGVITWYCSYIPLSPLSTVVAA